MASGGYRRPANPAPVSGPGAHSQRTDGKQPQMQLADAAYGEQKQFSEDQAGAAIPQEGGSSVPSAGSAGQTMPSFTGMGAPTQQPETPVTDGAAYGAGAGPDAVGQPDPDKQDAAYLQKYLPTLVRMAESDDTTPGMKTWVRQIIASS